MSALNTVDAEHILENAAGRPARADLRRGARQHPGLGGAAARRDDDVTTFVNVGRLSPEKNQARLDPRVRRGARREPEDAAA